MSQRELNRHFEELVDLSPWDIQQIQKNNINEETAQKPKRKRMKNIIPRQHPISSRKLKQKNPLKPIDYILPPVHSIKKQHQEHHSMTIQPSGKLLRNLSTHRLQQSQSATKLMPTPNAHKLKLSGKKCDMVRVDRGKFMYMEDRDRDRQKNYSFSYMNNNTMLLLGRKGDDVLRRVLGQIQGRIKEIGA